LQVARLRWCNDTKLGRIAELLPREQQHLLALWSGGAVSTRALAGVLGCDHGTLVRRVHAMHHRLSQPIALHIAQYGQQLAPTHREVALRLFIWGQPLRHVARDLGVTQHEVRRLSAEVRGWSAARTHANT